MRREKWLIFALFCLVLAAFLVAGFDKLHQGDELIPIDTLPYLRHARFIHEHGGPLRIIPMCFTGEYPVANQMPLYLAVLSLFPPDTPNVLAWGKLATLLLGAGAITVIYLAGRRLFGRWAALLGVALLAINTAFLTHAAMVACEVVLAMWITLAWFSMAKYLRTGRGAAWIGLFTGLAYMTKVSGLFLLPVVAGVLVFRERRRLLGSKQTWACVLLIALVCSPILVRDLVRFHSPSWFVTHTTGMWMDSPRDLEATKRRPRSFASYRREHSARDTVQRVRRGAFQEGVFTVIGSGETYLFKERLGWRVWPFGLAILFLACAAMAPRRLRPAVLSAAAVYGMSSLFFIWFPFKHIRFVMPRLPVVMLLAGAGAVYGLKRLTRLRPFRGRLHVERMVTATVAVLMSATVAFAVMRPNIWKNPARSVHFPPGYYELLDWIRGHIEPDTVWMIGPTHNYSYYWTDETFGTIIRMPWASSFADLQTFVIESRIRYVVVDWSVFRQRARLLSEFMEETGGRRLRLIKTPPGWRKVHGADHAGVFVFSVSPETRAAGPRP